MVVTAIMYGLVGLKPRQRPYFGAYSAGPEPEREAGPNALVRPVPTTERGPLRRRPGTVDS